MTLLGRARGWGFARPLHRVQCVCGRVFVLCSFPKAIRERRACAACYDHSQRYRINGTFARAQVG